MTQTLKNRNSYPKASSQAGLSIIEVIMAISIIAIMFAVLTPALIDSSKRTALSGQTGQSSLMLNFFVRQIVGGDSTTLAVLGTPLTWDYGSLSTSGFGLTKEKDLADPDLYKVTVSHEGTVTLLTATAVQYKTEVCFLQAGTESCIEALTLGPALTPTGVGPVLPGIN